MNRERFPGLAGGWARLDGPAGTQMVDVAIEAMDAWMRSGRNANHGGVFTTGRQSDAVLHEAHAAAAERQLTAGTPAWQRAQDIKAYINSRPRK